MKRFWGHAIAATGAIIIAANVFPACAHDDASIFINGVLAPPAAGASNGQGCLYTADPTQQHLTSGLVDVALLRSYSAILLIGNQLIPRASAEQGRVETSRVEIQGAIITVTDVAGNNVHAPYTRSAAMTVDPAQGATPGYVYYGLELVDHTILDPIASSLTLRGDPTRLLVHIKVFGNTLGGEHVETNDFQFPLDVCLGCLVTFPASAISPVTGLCTGASGGGGSATTFAPCVVGQDQPVPCSLCPTEQACVPPSGIVVPVPDAGPVDAAGGG
jgi:hypothetical protein